MSKAFAAMFGVLLLTASSYGQITGPTDANVRVGRLATIIVNVDADEVTYKLIGDSFDGFREAPLFDVAREPVDIAVLLEHFGALAVDIHEPTGVGAVHQLSAAAVAVRITVADVVDLPDITLGMKVFRYLFIGFPDLLALPLAFGVKTAVVDDRYVGET